MAWKVLQHGGKEWVVSRAAERHAQAGSWQLVLSFRPATGGTAVWAACELQSQSQAALFAQADRLADAELSALLALRLG